MAANFASGSRRWARQRASGSGSCCLCRPPDDRQPVQLVEDRQQPAVSVLLDPDPAPLRDAQVAPGQRRQASQHRRHAAGEVGDVRPPAARRRHRDRARPSRRRRASGRSARSPRGAGACAGRRRRSGPHRRRAPPRPGPRRPSRTGTTRTTRRRPRAPAGVPEAARTAGRRSRSTAWRRRSAPRRRRPPATPVRAPAARTGRRPPGTSSPPSTSARPAAPPVRTRRSLGLPERDRTSGACKFGSTPCGARPLRSVSWYSGSPGATVQDDRLLLRHLRHRPPRALLAEPAALQPSVGHQVRPPQRRPVDVHVSASISRIARTAPATSPVKIPADSP